MNKAFGYFEGKWAWRVEWTQGGKPKFKNFFQTDHKPGVAKEEADAFAEQLEISLAA